MVSRDEFEEANRRAQAARAGIPTAVSAWYDRKVRRVVVRLVSNVEVSFSPRDAQGLEHATPAQLKHIEISPSGLGIHFPKLDADLYIPALLEGFLGSRTWAAARLGRLGGRATSRAKRAAARANGRLGGRAKKARSGK